MDDADDKDHFNAFIRRMDKGERNHWVQTLKEDDRIFNKAVKKAEKITEKRKIRDAYRSWKIDLHDEDEEKEKV